MSKKKTDSRGFVYSTNPDFKFENEPESSEEFLPGQQKLKVRLDTKQRAGKIVTIIEGFRGKENELEELAKKLKTFCGTGGTSKDGEIILQGDHRKKVADWLEKNGMGTKGKG